jgi:hypothetical protein
MWEPQRLTTLWASTACYRGSFIFYYRNVSVIFIAYSYFRIIKVNYYLKEDTLFGIQERKKYREFFMKNVL